MTAIVFSKDRALQLDACLRSIARCVTPPLSLTVLWLATSSRHQQAYDDVFRRHPWATAVVQSPAFAFEEQVLAQVPTTGSVVCFVDDLLFIRPWAVTDQPVSLRLGLHLKHCYPTDTPQPVPPVQIDGDLVTWRWEDGAGDWGYPLSLDGQVFDAAELRAWIAASPCSSPNTLEAALQRFVPAFADRRGLCYTEARVVNVPWNRVQQDWANRAADDPDATPDRLLTLWEQGQQIDLAPLVGVRPVSCHQAFPVTVKARP